jgi:phage terminase small subunit
MVSIVDWGAIRQEYESTDIMLKDLALKYGLSDGTVRSRKNREGWQRSQRNAEAANMKNDKKVATKHRNSNTVATRDRKTLRERDSSAVELFASDLSPQRLLFAQEYAVDLNAKKAALRAGYAESTAEKYAAMLLKNTQIQEAVKQVMKDRADRLQITQDRVLEEYAKIAFSDIRDFVDFRTEKTVVGYDEEGQPIIDYKNIVDVRPSDQVDGRIINEISISKDGTLKFKLHDKKGALDMIGKHMKMFTEKVEMGGPDGEPLQVFFNVPRPKKDS